MWDFGRIEEVSGSESQPDASLEVGSSSVLGESFLRRQWRVHLLRFLMRVGGIGGGPCTRNLG